MVSSGDFQLIRSLRLTSTCRWIPVTGPIKSKALETGPVDSFRVFLCGEAKEQSCFAGRRMQKMCVAGELRQAEGGELEHLNKRP